MKALCRIPFEHVFVNNAGTLHACCVAYPQYTKIDEFGYATEERHLASHGLQKSWNSRSMQALRSMLNANKWPKACAVCKRQEISGLQSRRTREGLIESGKIRTLDLRLGNSCNLACRMCSPFSSRLLVKDWNDESPLLPAPSKVMQEATKALESEKASAWEDDLNFWSDLTHLAPDVEEIHFAGGEPFLNRSHLNFLDTFIERGRSRQIRLSYNTNLTHVPEWLGHLAENFSEVRILVSLDGAEEHAEYIRYPMKWKSFLESLEKLDRLKGCFPHSISVAFNTTLQVYSISGLHQLLTFLENHQFGNLPRETAANILHHPHYFDLAEMPDHQKSLALDLIGFARQKVSLPTSISLLDVAASQVRSERRTDARHTWGDFCQVTRRYDLQRKQDFSALSTWTSLEQS